MSKLKAKNFETHLFYPSGRLVFSSSRGPRGLVFRSARSPTDTGNNRQDQYGAAKIDFVHSATPVADPSSTRKCQRQNCVLNTIEWVSTTIAGEISGGAKISD
jgi:hypothetical protein